MSRLARLLTHAVIIVIAVALVSYASIAKGSMLLELHRGASNASAVVQGGNVGSLEVGQSAAIVAPAPIPTAVPVPHTPLTYQVGQTDTLATIASKFSVSPDQIRWSNPSELTEDPEVTPGQTLRLPPVPGIVTTIAKGQDLAALAAYWNVDPQTILDFNYVRNQSTDLAAGTTIVIPGARGPQLPQEVPPPPNLPPGVAGFSGPLTVGAAPGANHAVPYNNFPFGQCTYYVATRVTIPWRGDAWSWFGSAQSAGWSTGHTPRKGAIMVTWESAAYGHVAYVEQVYTDGSWLVSEMNYLGEGVVDQRRITPGSVPVIGFIYPAGSNQPGT
ncbi:MAG: CHAP domain-containing protein [Candidatus Dormiibacterota bacterium]